MTKKSKIFLMIISIFILVIFFAANYLINYGIKSGRAEDIGAFEEGVDEKILEYKKTKSEQDKITKEFLKNNKLQEDSIISDDNLKLQGYFLEDSKNTDWVLLLHGYRSKHQHLLDFARIYYEKGFNVLVPDMRASGNSEGKYIGMGYLEKNDAKKWIDWILQRNSNSNIIIHGVSMGAATTMLLSGEDLPEQVKLFIEDCGYTSAYDMFSQELKSRFNLPSFPLMNIADILSQIKAGYKFSDANPLEAVKKSSQPMLFIHGKEDNFIPVEMMHILYEAKTKGVKEKLIVENANHAHSMYASFDEYWNTVDKFIKDNFK